MPRPTGRPKRLTTKMNLSVTDDDRRRVDLMCAILGVGYSEFFHLMLAGTRELAHESLAADRQTVAP